MTSDHHCLSCLYMEHNYSANAEISGALAACSNYAPYLNAAPNFWWSKYLILHHVTKKIFWMAHIISGYGEYMACSRGLYMYIYMWPSPGKGTNCRTKKNSRYLYERVAKRLLYTVTQSVFFYVIRFIRELQTKATGHTWEREWRYRIGSINSWFGK